MNKSEMLSFDVGDGKDKKLKEYLNASIDCIMEELKNDPDGYLTNKEVFSLLTNIKLICVRRGKY